MGELATDFDEEVARLAKDCIARPSVGKVRELKLLIRFVPHTKQDGTCDDVHVDCQVVTRTPAKQRQPYLMRATVNGGLKFQPDSPLNPDQGSLGLEE
jgi:hypothetical protein